MRTSARSSATRSSHGSRPQLGVSEDEAADAVAQVLPAVVDKVSPDGQLAPDSELDATFGALEQLGGGTRDRLKPVAATAPGAARTPVLGAATA